MLKFQKSQHYYHISYKNTFFFLLKHNGSENVLSTYIPIIKPSIKTFPNNTARRAKIKIA